MAAESDTERNLLTIRGTSRRDIILKKNYKDVVAKYNEKQKYRYGGVFV